MRIASLGYAEGKLDVGNRQLACRRMDNDGDGIPLGWRDELWIDVNDDGLFDEISERFNYQPWLEIEKIKYGLQSDPFGQELRLINAPALGTVEFRLNLADPAAQVIDWQGIFRDRFGSFVPMQMDRSTVEVLPGEYCIESLAVTVKDGSGDQWYLIMSRLADANWFKIEENQNRSIELLSNLEMKIEPKISFGGNGEEVAIFTPYLISSDGLVMTEFKRNSTEGISLNLSMSRPELPQDSEGPMVSCSGFS